MDEQTLSAFACAAGTPDNGVWQEGMTLRDYFAGEALKGMLSTEVGGSAPKHEATGQAYHYADAMLEARKK